jgi:hypothetical protein
MVEIQILQRLKGDGEFPWLDNDNKPSSSTSSKNSKVTPLQNIHLCFFMRRHEVLRYFLNQHHGWVQWNVL